MAWGHPGLGAPPKGFFGSGEVDLWYSMGGAANFTDLASGFLGEYRNATTTDREIS